MRIETLVQRFIPVLECILICYSCSPTSTVKASTRSDLQSIGVPDKIEAMNTWTPRFTSGNVRYIINDSSAVSITGDSSHSSLIHTTAIYDITLTALNDSFLLTAKVESLTINSHLQTPKVNSQLDSVEGFHATISSSGRLSPIIEVLPSACVGGVNSVATRILELTPNYPQKQLKVGDKWTDTVSTTSCRGKTLLQQQNIYQSELAKLLFQNGRDLAQVQRNVTTTFHSLSSGSRNQLTTNGEGSSTSVLYIDRMTGMLLRSSTLSQIVLTITTARGNYPFTQNTSTQVMIQ